MIPAGRVTSSRNPAGIFRALQSAFALVAALTLSSTAAPAETLSGIVRYDGAPPQPRTIYMGADPACDKIYPEGVPADSFLVSKDGGLANALVFVSAGLPDDYVPPAPLGPANIDQRGCVYTPHVLGVRTGQEVAVRNGDSTIHNVNARTSSNQPFNLAMPAQDLVIRRSFDSPEVAVKLKCDIHPWMSAYIGVFAHPYFTVTDADGRFQLPGLPEGEYSIDVWHEVLGELRGKVEIEDGEPAVLHFAFAGN